MDRERCHLDYQEGMGIEAAYSGGTYRLLTMGRSLADIRCITLVWSERVWKKLNQKKEKQLPGASRCRC